jgi:hypothetical protein
MTTVYNYRKLRGMIREYCGTLKAYADSIGIGTTALHSRLNSDVPFTQEEIRKTNELFGITDPHLTDQIFFTKE